MSGSDILDALRRRGYGVTINAWSLAEERGVAVLAWLNGHPVADAVGATLDAALGALMRSTLAGEEAL